MEQFRSLQEWREAVLKEKKERRKEWAQMPYEVKMRIVQEMVQFADRVHPIREQVRKHLSTVQQKTDEIVVKSSNLSRIVKGRRS